MYSQAELDDAVAAGAISAEAAAALRAHVERQRQLPSADEEHFRLLTGFNDIFVSIAAAILLFAVGWIGQWAGQAAGFAIEGDGPSPLGGVFVAAAAWMLALFFTARRRMALPSILLLIAFVGGVAAALGFSLTLGLAPDGDASDGYENAILAGAALSGAAAAYLHWRRFHVPITVAAGAVSVVGLLMALLGAAADGMATERTIMLLALLVLGVAVFLFAMRWDATDPARVTRRSDVAFWLHLLAAPLIVHPVFTLLGLNDGDASVGEGFVVILLYVALGVAALAIDRRALLVSALAYVLYALNNLFREVGAVELNVALTALVIGSALLLLSAFWHQARSAIVRPLPQRVRDRLPIADRAVAVSQPAA